MAKTTSTPPDDTQVTVYIAKDTIDYNGTRYTVGDVIEGMTKEHAGALLDADVIVVDTQTVKAEQP